MPNENRLMLTCEDLNCHVLCTLEESQKKYCYVLNYANKMYLDHSKAQLMEEAEALLTGEVR